MKIVIGNYADPNDNRNLILNAGVADYATGAEISPLMTLISSVSGLETPPYRNGTGNWSGADGGYLGTQLYGARQIVIKGVYIDKQANCNYENATDEQFSHIARMYIRSRLPIRTEQLIRIFFGNNMTFFTKGYCTDLKMEYTYIGHGDFQITMYCPDPALYRGAANGGINSEWQIATLYKSQDVGFKSSWVEDDQVKYALMENIDGENKGYVWGTGGRSTVINYLGDFPCYPQLIVEPEEGQGCVNPSFYSVNQDKTFSLGFPDSSVAVFTVKTVDSDGTITAIEPDFFGGAYDADYSGRNIQMQNYRGTNDGYDCFLDLTATKDAITGLWEFSSVNIRNGGVGFSVGDKITPLIAGAAIFQLSAGQKLVIDMAEHTVMVYSGTNSSHRESYSYYITPGSEWFQLEPLTNNNIIFTSANPDDVPSAVIQWRNGYQGF